MLIAVRDEHASDEVPELQTDCEITWARTCLVKNLYILSYMLLL